jgi:hypothetical protein
MFEKKGLGYKPMKNEKLYSNFFVKASISLSICNSYG